MGAQIVDSVFTLSFDSIGTMTLGFFAVLIRNLNEKFHFYEFSIDFNDRIGDISLGLYLSMALLALKLWELAELALPLLALLCRPLCCSSSPTTYCSVFWEKTMTPSLCPRA